jgi:hypothetical protein
MRPDNQLLQSAYLTRADLLLKRVLMVSGGIVIGITWYVLVALRAGA